ncbi:hypothetical protein LZ198_31045 [Myxococcus sp. K15C18031901]|uniref:hypothetical protein n=1 Tax=Myxococcus dinghuensis TaxID=2906761 RepID=UPI0020A812C8|nr:hypothetical protein [Myxococcus dinghuensis]MCP3103328.1 hypothetical protein [Myxococcus dinghuensis]
MPRHLLTLLLALLVSACSQGDLCAEAPRCDDSEALNCETACAVGPCSTGPILQRCEQGTTCTVVPGSRSDPRFYRSRAVCAVNLSLCDPATAAAPTCDEDGRFVTGCGAHLREVRVFCSQAALYFEEVPPCCKGVRPDGGTGDGGVDGGISDAGTELDDAGS